MSQPPFDRKPTIGIVVPIVAIALAITIGALTKGKGRPRQYWGNGGPPISPGTGVSFAGSETGIGPAAPAADSVNGSLAAEQRHTCAAWARFDFTGAMANVFAFQGSARVSVVDSNGKAWPHNESWEGKSLYVLIPRGYSAPPKSLKLSTVLRDKEFASTTLSSLPLAKKATPPKLTPAWKGLVVESVRLLSDSQGERRIFVDSPVEKGEILSARVLATDFVETPDSTELGIKGPNPGKYLQAMLLSNQYPGTVQRAFVEVCQYSKEHVHKRVKFDALPYVEKFDSIWIAGTSASASLASTVKLQVMGHDLLPYRRGMNNRTQIPIYLASDGLVRNLKTVLLNPFSIRSVPIDLRSLSTTSNVKQPTSGQDWKSGPLEIEADVEADVFPLKRRAVVSVSLKSARTIIDPVGQVRSPYELRGKQFGDSN